MGYSTRFQGTLQFTKELTIQQAADLDEILEEDLRDRPDLKPGNVTYIDLEFVKGYKGLKWNGAEKTYHMKEAIELLLRHMRSKYPDFGLMGTLKAQGEEIDDRYQIVVENDKVRIVSLA